MKLYFPNLQGGYGIDNLLREFNYGRKRSENEAQDLFYIIKNAVNKQKRLGSFTRFDTFLKSFFTTYDDQKKKMIQVRRNWIWEVSWCLDWFHSSEWVLLMRKKSDWESWLIELKNKQAAESIFYQKIVMHISLSWKLDNQRTNQFLSIFNVINSKIFFTSVVTILTFFFIKY